MPKAERPRLEAGRREPKAEGRGPNKLRPLELHPQIADRALHPGSSSEGPPAPARRCEIRSRRRSAASGREPGAAAGTCRRAGRRRSPSRRRGRSPPAGRARPRRRSSSPSPRPRCRPETDRQVRVFAGRRGVDAGRVVGVLDLQADVARGKRRDREVAADVGDAAGDGEAPGVAAGSNVPAGHTARRARPSGRPPSSRTGLPAAPRREPA